MAYNLLKGKRGLVFGALDEQSIAWKVAQRCKAEGADLVLSNAPVAVRMGSINQLAKEIQAPVIEADVTNMEAIQALFTKTKEHYAGEGIDFLLHAIGMSMNVRKHIPYVRANYEYMHKSIDISAISLHRILQVAMDQDAINQWGSVVALTYIAAQRVFPDYNDMADAKAMLESITRNFGYQYAIKKQVRINTISQSPTRTTAGTGVKGFEDFINYAEKMSPLGNATADQCADYCVSLFSDLTRMVTMQNLYHDGGFSFTGISHRIIAQMQS